MSVGSVKVGWMGPGGRAIRRTPTTSAISWSGGWCSSTRSPTSGSPPSGASCACSALRGWNWGRARPASGTPSSARSPGSARPSGRSSSRRSGTSPGTTHFGQLRKLAGLDIQREASGQWAGTGRISRCGRPLLRWALSQAALGAARTPCWRARREVLIAKQQGDRFAFLKANVELAAKLLRLVWGVWRSGQPYDPARVDGAPAARPRPQRGRRGAPPLDKGQAEIVEPRDNQAGRSSGRRALRPRSGTSRRA